MISRELRRAEYKEREAYKRITFQPAYVIEAVCTDPQGVFFSCLELFTLVVEI